MTDWKIERLADHHDRSGFDCGKPPLNDWLIRFAGQYERRGLARTYVLLRPGDNRALGYYALSNRHVDFVNLPPQKRKGLPSSLPIPTALIGRLAVDRVLQGQGLGDVLLVHALRRVLTLSEEIGIVAVLVEAIDDQARDFYLHRNFEPLTDNPRRLFVLVDHLRRSGLEPL